MKDSGTILYRKFLAGDANALEELVRIYSDALVRFSYSYVRDFQTAEDIMADTFATLMIKRKNFREIAQFKTYLYKIARNKAIDHLRAQKKFYPSPNKAHILLPQKRIFFCGNGKNRSSYTYKTSPRNMRKYCNCTISPDFLSAICVKYCTNHPSKSIIFFPAQNSPSKKISQGRYFT